MSVTKTKKRSHSAGVVRTAVDQFLEEYKKKVEGDFDRNSREIALSSETGSAISREHVLLIEALDIAYSNIALVRDMMVTAGIVDE